MKVKNYTILMMIGMNDIELLIIPDVHGRFFWKEPIKYIIENTDKTIVFLGDYVDPYDDDFFNENNEPLYENIGTINDMLKNTIKILKEIIALKKLYPDRIILLLGNHDCSYMIGTEICKARYDRSNCREISNLFKENKDLFQLAYETTINDKHIIFSHAGINKLYAYDCFGEENVNEHNVVSLFNDAFKNDNYGVIQSLGMYSFFRGFGGGSYGSLIWADAREWYNASVRINRKNEPFCFSVVGHTQLKTHCIDNNIAFLDSKECFIIDKEGNIKKFEEII